MNQFALLAFASAFAVTAGAAVPYRLGIARYTMHKAGPQKALEIMQRIDCHYLGLLEDTIAYDATDEQIAAYKANQAKYGVETVTAGPLYYSTEAEARAFFAFAKRWGMKTVSVVPFETKEINGRKVQVESEAMLDVLEKLVKEYDIRAGIHNHGPDIPHLYPTAEAVWARIEKRDARIGFCLDVGHQRRAGNDPAAAIRKYAARLYDVHLKNIKIDAKRNLAMPGPRGELDVPAILLALADVGYSGTCLVEYEKDFSDNETPLAESIGYYRGIMDVIGRCPGRCPKAGGCSRRSGCGAAR